MEQGRACQADFPNRVAITLARGGPPRTFGDGINTGHGFQKRRCPELPGFTALLVTIFPFQSCHLCKSTKT